MKNFQRNLFIVLAIGLCSTCAYQWYLQSVQFNTIERLNQMVYQKSADIQGYTNSIKSMDAEINQLHDRVTYLKQTVMSNDKWAVTEKHEVARLQSSGDLMSNEIVQYKTAVDRLTSKLKETYDGIKKQNEAITNLIAQRDDFVKKYNDSVKDRNDIVGKYNELAKQVEKQSGSSNKQ